MISSSLLLSLFIQLVIGGLIFYILYWLIGKIALPEPINKVALVLLAVLCAIWLINILLTLGGNPLIRWG
jgi:hypothetical protein